MSELAVSRVSIRHTCGDRIEHAPKFGTHDYIAFMGLDRAPAARVRWIRQNRIAYFIGTEAPDTGKPVQGVAATGYHDSGACHCVLFDAAGTVTRPRAIQRVSEEVGKALAAFRA